MSILQHNGAAIVCMAGKDCVAIAADTRFGLQQQTVACDFQKVFKMTDRVFVGLAGLATDVQTLRATLKFKLALYALREERIMKPEVDWRSGNILHAFPRRASRNSFLPVERVEEQLSLRGANSSEMIPQAFSALLSHMLYEKRFGPLLPVRVSTTDFGRPEIFKMSELGRVAADSAHSRTRRTLSVSSLGRGEPSPSPLDARRGNTGRLDATGPLQVLRGAGGRGP